MEERRAFVLRTMSPSSESSGSQTCGRWPGIKDRTAL